MNVWHRSARAFGLAGAGLAMLGATALLPAPAALAATNLVATPSGVGGSTTGWSAPSTWGPLTGVQVNGVWWLHWVSNDVQSHQPGPGSAWYSYILNNLSPGQTISCGMKVMGSGTIVEDVWTGNNGGDHFSAPVTLSSTPQVITLTETVGAKPWPATPPAVQARYNSQTGNLNIYFTDVTCVVGNSVQLVADSTGAAAGAGSASTSTSTTTGTSTGSGSSSGGGSSSSLPKTGGGPLPWLGGLVAAAGAGLLLRRPRRRV